MNQQTPSNPPLIRGVIAVQNYGVSGSTLLQSLLDEHPEVVSIPGLYAQQLYPFYDQCGHLPFQELANAFRERFGFFFDREKALTDPNPLSLGLHQMGPNRDEPLLVDMMEFFDALGDHYRPHEAEPQETRRRHFIVAAFLAYHAARAQKRPLAGQVWILYPIHSLPLRYAQWMRADFEQHRIIHMVRDPLRNLASTMRFTASKPEWWIFDGLQRAVAQILTDHQIFAEITRVNGYRPFFDDNEIPSVAIRLEDLHENPKPVMLALVAWIGIAWDECLLHSTFAGKQWWNRPESKRVSGTDPSMNHRPIDDMLSARDRFILAPLLCRQYRAWGYGKPASRLQLLLHAPLLLLPLSRETPDDNMRRRYAKWCEENKLAPSPAQWRRYRLDTYLRCRNWLFLAWKLSLLDNEKLVKLLPWGKP